MGRYCLIQLFGAVLFFLIIPVGADEVTIYPAQDTTSWQMKQKDMHHTGRAAFVIAGSRLDDIFFDDILWQTPAPGAFNGASFIYYDGAGPDGADVASCSNTWPSKVTGVDRHTGEVFWQESPGGGDQVGRSSQAFSNDGSVIYGTHDAAVAKCFAFATLAGPGVNGANVWDNSADIEPRHLQRHSPTVGPDGRVFLHQWNGACYAGQDTGSAIQEVWATTENLGIGYSGAALYQNGDYLMVVHTGRGSSVTAFDGVSGAVLWSVTLYQGTDSSATIDPENGNIYFNAGWNRELYVVGLDKDGNDLWSSTKILLNDSENDPNRLERARATGCLGHDGQTYYFQSTGENTDNGKLYAINTFDGSLKWTYETHSQKSSDEFVSSPIVTENKVVIVGNNHGGEYLVIKDDGDHGTLIDSILMEPELNDPSKRQAKASAVISADGKLYLPLRTYWTVGNGGGDIPDGTVRYCLTAFDLSGCDGPVAMDFNDDCRVNLIDLAEFTSHWLDCGLQPAERCLE